MPKAPSTKLDTYLWSEKKYFLWRSISYILVQKLLPPGMYFIPTSQRPIYYLVAT